jgi:hypothetical protein
MDISPCVDVEVVMVPDADVEVAEPVVEPLPLVTPSCRLSGRTETVSEVVLATKTSAFPESNATP